MGRRASIADGVGNVALVVRAVHILAIPACREADRDHDTGRAWLSGEVGCLSTTGHGRLEASEVHVFVSLVQFICGADARVTDGHTETGLEGRDLAG